MSNTTNEQDPIRDIAAPGTSPDSAPEASLRERSKARRQAAIAHAALTLFSERGYDQVTVAQVAAAADVAPRTVSLYFPTKLDLALAYSSPAAARLTALLDEQPAETAFATLQRWIATELESHGEMLALQQAVFATNPSLSGAQTQHAVEARHLTEAALARDLGRPSDDMIVKLVGAAMGGVVAALIALHPSGDGLSNALDLANQIISGAVTAVAEPPKTV